MTFLSTRFKRRDRRPRRSASVSFIKKVGLSYQRSDSHSLPPGGRGHDIAPLAQVGRVCFANSRCVQIRRVGRRMRYLIFRVVLCSRHFLRITHIRHSPNGEVGRVCFANSRCVQIRRIVKKLKASQNNPSPDFVGSSLPEGALCTPKLSWRFRC